MQTSPSRPFAAGEAIVALRGGSRPAGDDSFAEKYGCSVQDCFEMGGPNLQSEQRILHIKMPEGMNTEQALAEMSKDPNVLYAEPNYIYQLDPDIPTDTPPAQSTSPSPGTLVPNDLDSRLWGMNNTGQNGGTANSDINAPEAWAIHTGRADGPIIAVIDTGIDYRHPDLAKNLWVNPGEIAGNGKDDDGNGVIDDVFGYNAFDNSGDPLDGNGHGTHCAGTIGAVGNNNLGVVGVNHQAQMMAVKIFNDKGETNAAAILRGIEYATKNGATITSNSWGGGPYSQAQRDAFAASPALHIMAAGNNGGDNDKKPNYPSNYELDNNLAVAASDRRDKKASFSQFGKTTVDLAAPGVDIYSTLPNNRYGSLSGTSMATPHVAGAAGLVASAFPELDAAAIKAKLLEGADKLKGWESFVVDGNRLNLEGALKA